MKSTNTLIIPPVLYKSLISSSYNWDNYIQVYLWKILIYQKILFHIEIEVDESELKSDESREGYDLYLHIS
ncbi:hypothetical protein NAPIS_ORF02770 [Vairimorpha apis BRL 01]|uniref:Uncharacterized protein n=1 Tax=Vairimorpha apis BRL 01 TaxID=1037528 RepID=T0L583_9MICR|nr:hypothetical protein NAPIS_ORF02770 [Vairimorpha apis BRL 01]